MVLGDNGRNHTIQWSIISEPLHRSVHPKGAHGFAASVGGKHLSMHHNLFANAPGRNPSLAGPIRMDFRNNVIYNWQYRTLDGGVTSINIVNNLYKAGPATRTGLERRIVEVEAPSGRYYIDGNYVTGFPDVTAENWAGGVDIEGDFDLSVVRSDQSVPVPPVMTQSAVEAFELILNCAGAVLPRRDSVDARVVEEVRSGEAMYGVGIVNSPQDVGGWPELRSEPAPADSDGDGMPDVWERERGYDPNDAADGNEDFNRDGYTNLEDYLNELAEPAFPEGYLDSWRTKWLLQ